MIILYITDCIAHKVGTFDRFTPSRSSLRDNSLSRLKNFFTKQRNQESDTESVRSDKNIYYPGLVGCLGGSKLQ